MLSTINSSNLNSGFATSTSFFFLWTEIKIKPSKHNQIMLKIIICYLLLLGIIPFTYAQDSAQLETNQDIEQAVLGYIENFFENNTEEMFQYLHPQLAKRGISQKRGENTFFFEDMSKERLQAMLAKKKALPKSEQENKVIILDTFQNTAAVRLETGYPNRMKWIEYIHLSKTHDQWLITNVIWDYYPTKKRSRKRPANN